MGEPVLDTATGLITAQLFKDKCLQKADSQCADLKYEIADLTNLVVTLERKAQCGQTAVETMHLYIKKRFDYRFKQYEERLSKQLLLNHPAYVEITDTKPGDDKELLDAKNKVVSALEEHLREMKKLLVHLDTLLETFH